MKKFLKNVANVFATLMILPFIGLFYLGAVLFGAGRVFPGWSQLLSLVPGIFGIYARKAFYKFVFPHVGQDVSIGFGTVFSHPTASLGHKAYCGIGCMIGDAEIADDVLIGSHVSILNGNRQHGIEQLDIPVREQLGDYPRITIGSDSWIGDRAIVMVNVGKHCVVGAGSVVTKPVDDYEIVVGNPAKVIGRRDQLLSVKDSA